MKASPFELQATLGTRRPIIRRNPGDAQEVEMVEAGWDLQPLEGQGTKPFKYIRSAGKTFPTHRCLIPASEFQVENGDRRFGVTLEDGNWFYLAGVWRPANPDWPLSYAVVTIEANPDVFFYQERQGAVLLQRQRMEWLDLTVPQEDAPATSRPQLHGHRDRAARARTAPDLTGLLKDQGHASDATCRKPARPDREHDRSAQRCPRHRRPDRSSAGSPYRAPCPSSRPPGCPGAGATGLCAKPDAKRRPPRRRFTPASPRSRNGPRRTTERQSDARSVLEAAVRFPLSDTDSGIGFESRGFQEPILFADDLPW